MERKSRRGTVKVEEAGDEINGGKVEVRWMEKTRRDTRMKGRRLCKFLL